MAVNLIKHLKYRNYQNATKATNHSTAGIFALKLLWSIRTSDSPFPCTLQINNKQHKIRNITLTQIWRPQRSRFKIQICKFLDYFCKYIHRIHRSHQNCWWP